jgi:hypothetical protein
VSSGDRYQRDHDEEPTMTYQLGPTEEAKSVPDECGWCYVLRREKRVSAVAVGVEENDSMVSYGRQRGDDVGAYRWRQWRRTVKRAERGARRF